MNFCSKKSQLFEENWNWKLNFSACKFKQIRGKNPKLHPKKKFPENPRKLKKCLVHE